jgi:hypothetical protein
VKELELRKHANCTACSKPVMHTGLPLFWRVTVERFGVNLTNTNRQDGLAQYLGNTRLAQIMGPDLDMAARLIGPRVVTLCDACATRPDVPPIAALIERVPDTGEPS